MAMCRVITFAAVSRLGGLSWHQVVAICKRYVELGLAQADFSEVTRLAADETSKARGHDYITLVADADWRRVLFVTEGRDADTIKGLRWKLLRDRASLTPDARADLDAFVAQATTKPTARAWLCKEQLCEILERKQVNVVRDMLSQWTTNIMRSKVEPMKEVAKMIRSHLDGIVAWTQTPDQWLPRSHQQPVPGRQAQGTRLWQLLHDAHHRLPPRRQARFQQDQPPCRLTHSIFKRATIPQASVPRVCRVTLLPGCVLPRWRR